MLWPAWIHAGMWFPMFRRFPHWYWAHRTRQSPFVWSSMLTCPCRKVRTEISLWPCSSCWCGACARLAREYSRCSICMYIYIPNKEHNGGTTYISISKYNIYIYIYSVLPGHICSRSHLHQQRLERLPKDELLPGSAWGSSSSCVHQLPRWTHESSGSYPDSTLMHSGRTTHLRHSKW